MRDSSPATLGVAPCIGDRGRLRRAAAHASTRALLGQRASRARRAAGRSSRGDELAPIRPTRQILPASGPRPAPISMLNSSSRCLRTAASSTPSGTRTAFSVHSRSPSRGSSERPSARERRRRARGGCARAAPSARRALPLRRSTALRTARRPASTTSCGDTCGAASSPRAAEIEVEAAALHAPLERARAEDDRRQPRRRRRGISACSCSRRRCPTPPTSSGMPPSDVTASTIVSAPCSRAIAASSRTGFSDAGRRLARAPSRRRRPASPSACARSASGSHARPHSTSSARDRRAVALAHLREPIAEVAGDDDERARALA